MIDYMDHSKIFICNAKLETTKCTSLGVERLFSMVFLHVLLELFFCRVFSRMFVETILECRGSVSLRGREEICYLFRIIKMISLWGKDKKSLQAISFKDQGFQRGRCPAVTQTYCVFRIHKDPPPDHAPETWRWTKGNWYKHKVHVSCFSMSNNALYLWPRSLMSYQCLWKCGRLMCELAIRVNSLIIVFLDSNKRGR